MLVKIQLFDDQGKLIYEASEDALRISQFQLPNSWDENGIRFYGFNIQPVTRRVRLLAAEDVAGQAYDELLSAEVGQ